jgi:hypothetical protein
MLGIELGIGWNSNKATASGPVLRSGQFRLDGLIVGCQGDLYDDGWTVPVVNVDWQEGQWVFAPQLGDGNYIQLGSFTPVFEAINNAVVVGPAYNSCSGPV